MSSVQDVDTEREDYVVTVVEFAEDQANAVQSLKRIFGLDDDAARAIVSDVPVVVRSRVNRIRAEYFRRALELSGAHVEVRDAQGNLCGQPQPGTHGTALEAGAALRAHAGDAEAGLILQPSAATQPGLAAAIPAYAAPPVHGARPAAVSGTLFAGSDLAPVSGPAPPAVSASTAPRWGELDKPVNPKAGLSLAAAKPAASAPTRDAEIPIESGERRVAPVEPDAPEPSQRFRLDGQRDSAPKYDAIPPGERWQAPGATTMAKAQHRQAAQALESSLGEARLPSVPARHDRSDKPLTARDGLSLGPPAGASPAPPRASRPSSRQPATPSARPRVAAGVAAGAETQALHATPVIDARARPRVSSPAPDPLPGPGFWDVAALTWSGSGSTWLLLIATGGLALGGAASLCRTLPLLGVPLALALLTLLLAWCGEFQRHAFWAAATAERMLSERPDLELPRRMRSGLPLVSLALFSQPLLIVWLIRAVGDGRGPIEIVTSPVPWVLGCAPGFYWTIGLALAASRNRFRDVWDISAGMRLLGRAPLAIATLILATGVTFAISLLLSTALLANLHFGTPFALAAASGLPLALSHGLMGAWMGRLMRNQPDVFSRSPER